MSAYWILLLLLLSLLGSAVNIPLTQVRSGPMVSRQIVDFFGMRYVIPIVGQRRSTVIAINLGGAIVPTLISICVYCHGSGGKGDGDMSAILVIPPADLTQISTRNKGVFPFWQVYQMIDGRQEVRGHGDRTMPIWGFIFQAEEGPIESPQQIDVVRRRIWQLVYYLESIQEK